jgi:hypothetical protein
MVFLVFVLSSCFSTVSEDIIKSLGRGFSKVIGFLTVVQDRWILRQKPS